MTDRTTVDQTDKAQQASAAEQRDKAGDPPDGAGVRTGAAEPRMAPAAPRVPGARDDAADRRLGVRVIVFLLTLCLTVVGWGTVTAVRHTNSTAAAHHAALVKLPTPPPPRLVQVVDGAFTIPGVPKSIPWPSDGQSAIEIEGAGSLGTSGDVSTPVPIASVTKTMTAYLILADHPLSAGDSGPTITISESEAATYRSELKSGESVVEIVAGEQISERDALEALMLASADNVARVLARWDAGSASAFVADMNRAARKLGMTHTKYTDPSGLDPSTVSTATDQIKLAEAAMRSASFRAIVGTRVADIPVQGTIVNLNRLLGQYGVIGIKTGSTGAAGGCLLFAATVSFGGQSAAGPLGGQTETIIGAVFGQPLGSGDDFLYDTLAAASKMIQAAERSRVAVTVAAPGTLVASVRRSSGAGETQYGVASPVTVIGRPGQTYSVLVSGDASAATLVVTSTGGASAGSTPSLSVPLVAMFARGAAAAE